MSKVFPISIVMLVLVSVFGYFILNATGLDSTAGGSAARPDCSYPTAAERITCWHEYITELAKNGHTATALDEVATLYETEGSFRTSCHDFMHTIGEESYYRFMNDESFTVSPNISLCTYGFYHGFLDTLIVTTGNYQEARAFCEYTNERLTESGIQNDTLLENCYHGIGHGTIDEHRPDQNTDPYVLTEKTLTLCTEVTDTDQQLHDCATGVFNGIANYYMDGSLGWEIDKADPVAICRVQPDRFKNTCNAFMARVILSLNDYDVLTALNQIEVAVEPEYVGNVIKNLTLIRVANGGGLSLVEQADFITTCQSLTAVENRENCVMGLAAGLVQAGDPQVPYEAVTTLCLDTQLTESESAACLSYAHENITIWYTEQQRQEYCTKLQATYSVSCQG